MLTISPDVKAAIESRQPVVALESTLISHGLPYPQNRDLALQIETDIQDSGCVPASIAVLNGQIHVGLNRDQIEFLATGSGIHKLNASDIPLCVAKGESGATTVSGTMLCCRLAGIKFFATGGIGGVHRGAAQSFDISQDLTAFRSYPVAVITAGAKSILDLPKTLEVLETYGIPVIGYQTSQFPAFWSRDSGLSLTWRAENADQIAHMAREHWSLNPSCGMLVANPIPASHEIPSPQIETVLQASLAEADRDGVKGKSVTPYLLRKIREYLPASMEANIALIRHNARTAAALARTYWLQA
jgi:pseudouridine-5'-phosphate glycosidase